MNLIIKIFFLLKVEAITLDKDFNQKESVLAQTINNNYSLIENHLSSRGTYIQFPIINTGDIIEKELLETPYNMVMNLSDGQNIFISNKNITSSLFSEVFYNLENFINNKLMDKEVQ